MLSHHFHIITYIIIINTIIDTAPSTNKVLQQQIIELSSDDDDELTEFNGVDKDTNVDTSEKTILDGTDGETLQSLISNKSPENNASLY